VRTEPRDLPTRCDVLVLGAGIAGHCAALAAAEAVADVLFLEKAAQPGGSSAMAGGIFLFTGTDLQKAAGEADSLQALRQDLLEAGGHRNNPELVDLFVQNQLATYEFLRDHGVKFQLAPSKPPAPARSHHTGTGRSTTALHEAALGNPRIRFFANAAGARLCRSPETGRVDGAVVTHNGREIKIDVSRAVVLASGGFSRSSKLLQAYAPELVDAVKHGGIANTGDGLIMATALGAGHADLGYVSGSFGGAIRNYPNVVHNDDEIPPLLFAFNSGAIIVNKNGVRFANEAQSYKVLSGICMTQPDGLGFQIFDEKVMGGSLAGTSVNNFKEALADGYIQTAGSIGELAKLMGIDPTALEATIARYNKDAVSGLDSQFGRRAASGALMRIDAPPYYIAATGNVITSTYGGLTANADMAVLDLFGEPIVGLFAAGELVGGFHGASYLSASALPKAAISGLRAGKSAAMSNT
jgi:fumarate reductase flavoprotein subunit